MRIKNTLVITLNLLLVSTLLSFGQNVNPNVFNSVDVLGKPMHSLGDYSAIGVNPASLGIKDLNSKFSIGLMEINGTLNSRAFKQRKNEVIGTNSESNSLAEKRGSKFGNFFGENTQIAGDIRQLGLSYYNEKIGGIGFSTNTRFGINIGLNQFAYDALFTSFDFENYLQNEIRDAISKNQSSIDPNELYSLSDGTSINLKLYQEFNVSYGRKIFSKDDIVGYGGIGIKYLMGMANANLRFTDSGIEGNLTLPGSFSGDYPGFNLPESSGGLAQGGGIGIDVGATFVIAENYKIGASVTDIGSIKWKGNSINYKQDILDNIHIDLDNINRNELIKQYNKVLEDGIFEYGPEESYREQLPTMFNFAAEAKFNDWLSPNLDVVVPMNSFLNNHMSPSLSLSNHMKLFDKVKLYTGLTYFEMQEARIPFGLGVTFGSKLRYEVSVTTKDLLGLASRSRNEISLNAAYLKLMF